MEYRQISLTEIQPFVRFAQEIFISSQKKQIIVQSYDHRLFYVINGTAKIEINGTSYDLSSGNVLYWMSGTSYCVLPQAGSTLQMISINFDFLQDNAQTIQFLPVVPPRDYQSDRRLEVLSFSDAPVLNEMIFLREAPSLLPFLRAMVAEATSAEVFHTFQLSSLLCVVINLLQRYASTGQSVKGRVRSYKQILDYIQANYAQELDNRTLADQFGYHPNYMSRLVLERTGCSLHKYLLKIRIQNALYLLQNSDLPVSEISQQVGFKNVSYFSQYFKKCTGYSPSAFRAD